MNRKNKLIFNILIILFSIVVLSSCAKPKNLLGPNESLKIPRSEWRSPDAWLSVREEDHRNFSYTVVRVDSGKILKKHEIPIDEFQKGINPYVDYEDSVSTLILQIYDDDYLVIKNISDETRKIRYGFYP
ncbi:hypothetical protein GHK52_02630 [Lactococcus garvieae]|nr:hypothetical protein [Lactococcus garvieae]